MKKVLILLMALFLSCATACGTKEEEKKPEENENNTQTNTNNDQLENENDLTEEDLGKISTLIETSRKDNNTSLVSITYTNKSTKDFEVTTIKLIAKKGESELFSKTKEVNEKIAPGESKKYEFEVNASSEELAADDVDLNWEMIG